VALQKVKVGQVWTEDADLRAINTFRERYKNYNDQTYPLDKTVRRSLDQTVARHEIGPR
jgi:hypothetical protein